MKTKYFVTILALVLGIVATLPVKAQTNDANLDATAVELQKKADLDSLNIAANEEAATYLWKQLHNGELAMKYYGRVLRQAERTGNKMTQVKTLWQMSRISSDAQDFTQAADYLEKDLELVKDMDRLKNKERQMANILFNIAVSYLSNEDFDKAEAAVEEGLAIPGQDQTDFLQLQQQIRETKEQKAKREHTMAAIGSYDRAQVYFKQGMWEQAIATYADVIELYADNPENISYITAQFDTGVSYMKLGQNEQALPFLAEGMDKMHAYKALTPAGALAYADMVALCAPTPELQETALPCYFKTWELCKERAGASTLESAEALTKIAKSYIVSGDNAHAKYYLDKADIAIRKAGRQYKEELMKVRAIKKQL